MRIVGAIGVFSLCVFGVVAGAEPVSNAEAKAQLFSLKGREVELIPRYWLTPDNAALVEQVAEQQLYYAAIAASPDDGILNPATIAAANDHTMDVARAKALSACDAAKRGQAACEIVAMVRPRNFEPVELTLSHGATEAWRKSYRRVRGEKAFAISPTVGTFVVATGEGAASAALSACAEQAQTDDCLIVIQD